MDFTRELVKYVSTALIIVVDIAYIALLWYLIKLLFICVQTLLSIKYL